MEEPCVHGKNRLNMQYALVRMQNNRLARKKWASDIVGWLRRVIDNADGCLSV
jgi:hypothetical protein